MVRYRRSTNEWVMDYDSFKAADPGHIWATITGQKFIRPRKAKGVEGTRRGLIR